jgi:Protein of unknown function (DUF1826)
MAAGVLGGGVSVLRAANAIAMGSRSREGTSPIMLGEVRRPEVDVALWRREVPASLSTLRAWAASTNAPSFDRVVTIDAEAIAAAVSRAPSSLRGALAADVAMLLGYFVAVAGTARCRLFFGTVRDDNCRKFHVDAVAVRMVTTYVGPGTEWLSEQAVNRAALARLIECPSDANAAIVCDPGGVRRAREGDVLMLKGSRDPNVGGKGAVHRSPPLREPEVRLVLIATAGGPPP